MATSPLPALIDAKERLDRLIANARSQGLMPITIAETLFHVRAGTARLSAADSVRKNSYHWCAAMNQRLFKKGLSLNRSYWDKLFTDHMPRKALAALDSENRTRDGIAEAYVYARLRQTVESLQPIRAMVVGGRGGVFSLAAFLNAFENDPKLRRSVDKAYEIVVHALFNAVATRVQAQVTVSVTMRDPSVLADFQDFCEMLLGVNADNPSVTVPAKLYRVGGANSRDGGVDLWANFGPAIQVKHVTLDETKAQPIADAISADQMVIVCDKMERASIEAVMKQVGLASRVRGFITKADLTRWYDLALNARHVKDMAGPLFGALLAEFDDEFSLADPAAINAVMGERGYDRLALAEMWAIDKPVQRGKKKTASGSTKTRAAKKAKPRRGKPRKNPRQ